MSFFFSLKNKLGVIALVGAFSFAIAHGHAKSADEVIPQASHQELLLLKIDDLYYVMMVKPWLPQDKDHAPQRFSNTKEDYIPLNISRKQYKEIKEHEEVIKNLMSSSGRDLPE